MPQRRCTLTRAPTTPFSLQVKGATKPENQDRAVALQSLLSSLQAAPSTSSCLVASPPSSCAPSSFVYSAVFDGHGGCDAASHAAERLQQIVQLDNMLWQTLGKSGASHAW